MGLKKEIKETFGTAKKICDGSYKSKYTSKQIFWGMGQALKNPFFFIFMMILVFAFMSGFVYGAKKGQEMCNEYISETFADPESPYASPLLVAKHFVDNSPENFINFTIP